MSAFVIDGKLQAEMLRKRVAEDVAQLQASGGLTPGLAVVLVGDDPASAVYVRSKAKQTVAAGMASFEHVLPSDTTEADLLALIDRLNGDVTVHGILVQLPLPATINSARIISAISPAKDVDGFHPINVGNLGVGHLGFIPCTPMGCLKLIKSVRPQLDGMEAVIVGRSAIVGKPMAQLLLGENCTVTIAHSRSRDLPEICRRAEILVAAVGRANLIRGDWIRPGAIVIDVGINRITREDGTSGLVGDVCFDEAVGQAGAITPVPGGVGPMTIACLLANTLEAAKRSAQS